MVFYTSLGSALTDITAMLDPNSEDGMSAGKLVMLILQVVGCSLFLLGGILWGSKIIRKAMKEEEERRGERCVWEADERGRCMRALLTVQHLPS